VRRSIVCVLVLILIVSGLALVACGGNKEQAPSGEAAGQAGKTVAETEREGKTSGKSGRGWGDVPEYKGAVPVEGEVPMSVPAAAQGDYERTERRQYQTDDTPEQVHEYYLKQMPGKGWHKLFAMKYPEGSTVSAWVKGDEGRGCVISAGTLRDGKTYIGLLLNEGKK